VKRQSRNLLERNRLELENQHVAQRDSAQPFGRVPEGGRAGQPALGHRFEFMLTGRLAQLLAHLLDRSSGPSSDES